MSAFLSIVLSQYKLEMLAAGFVGVGKTEAIFFGTPCFIIG